MWSKMWAWHSCMKWRKWLYQLVWICRQLIQEQFFWFFGIMRTVWRTLSELITLEQNQMRRVCRFFKHRNIDEFLFVLQLFLNNLWQVLFFLLVKIVLKILVNPIFQWKWNQKQKHLHTSPFFRLLDEANLLMDKFFLLKL